MQCALHARLVGAAALQHHHDQARPARPPSLCPQARRLRRPSLSAAQGPLFAGAHSWAGVRFGSVLVGTVGTVYVYSHTSIPLFVLSVFLLGPIPPLPPPLFLHTTRARCRCRRTDPRHPRCAAQRRRLCGAIGKGSFRRSPVPMLAYQGKRSRRFDHASGAPLPAAPVLALGTERFARGLCVATPVASTQQDWVLGDQ